MITYFIAQQHQEQSELKKDVTDKLGDEVKDNNIRQQLLHV